MSENQNLEEMLTELVDLKIEFGQAIEAIKVLERKIKAQALDSGELCEVPGGALRFKRGYTRRSWNNASLQGYAAAGHEEILQFCKVTDIGPSCLIDIRP